MIAVLARLNVAAGKESDFEAVMLGLAEQVRANEPGNKLYTLVKDAEGYAVMELYDDEEALAAHSASEHFKAAGGGANQEVDIKGEIAEVVKNCRDTITLGMYRVRESAWISRRSPERKRPSGTRTVLSATSSPLPTWRAR